MPKVALTDTLRSEYENLFNQCAIRAERAAAIESIVSKLMRNNLRYETVSSAIGVPWFFVAVVHNMESSLDFTRHLHNGDPLTARTVQVPAGRPKTGEPPFTWEESAEDALSMKSLTAQTDWSLAGTLYQLERYNGWGYRLYHPHVLSPYLWSGSSLYTSGKYIADGTWSDTATSKQDGAAVLLRRLAEREHIEFADQPAPAPSDAPLVVNYATKASSNPVVVQKTEDLQRWLNTFPGVFVKVDGVAGRRTSEAYRKITGSYLKGDPRST
jgi:lysozyme family protein